jgi:hypothetical protein
MVRVSADCVAIVVLQIPVNYPNRPFVNVDADDFGLRHSHLEAEN